MDYTLQTPPFKKTPMAHQQAAFTAHWDATAWGHFWEQGTGKTCELLAQAAALYMNGLINTLVVIAPNGVHTNWVTDEAPKHLPDRVWQCAHAFAYYSAKGGTLRQQQKCNLAERHPGFVLVAMTYDALTTEKGKAVLGALLKKRDVMIVADESHRIKNPTAARTKVAIQAAKLAKYRRILTGTPVAQGPLDIYSQIAFLDIDFWKLHELAPYTVFKNHFAVWRKVELPGGGRFEQLVGYRRIDELNQILSTITDRVTKDDVLDLPPKVYKRRYYELTPEQKRVYRSIRDEYMALLGGAEPCAECQGAAKMEYEGIWAPCPACEGTGKAVGGIATASLAIVRLLRLQQVCCGYVPLDILGDEDERQIAVLEGGNPLLDALADEVEDLPENTQFIVFSRFTKDVELILARLAKMKVSAVRYDGKCSDEELIRAKADFVEGRARAFVANQQKACEGLTLTQATSVFFYANSFKLVERLQAEDRAHRIGQSKSVTYTDFVAENTVTRKLLDALQAKLDVANQITGDQLRDWFRDE